MQSDAARLERLVLKGTPAQGLFGATLGFFVGFAAVSLFGPTAARFQEVMELSPGRLGLLIAMPALSGSLLRIPFSAWVDTTGGRKPFLVLLSMAIVGMVGLFVLIAGYYPDGLTAGMYPLLLLFGLLSGCGIATFSVGISQVSYWHPQDRQGTVLGTYAGVGNLAPGIFSFLLPIALSSWGLAWSYGVWLAFLIAGTLLYAAFGRNSFYFQYLTAGARPEQARELARAKGQALFPAGTTLTSLGVSAGIWKTWVLVAIYFTTFGGFIALTAWFPTYWVQFMETSAVAAGTLTACYSILTSVTRVMGGGIADRLGGERTLMAALFSTAAGATLVAFAGTVPMALAGAVVLALGMGVANAAVFKIVPQEIPQAVGGAAGWVGGLGAFGGFAIPPIMAWFVGAMGRDGYARGFLVFVVLAAISLAFAVLLRAARLRSPLPCQSETT